VPFKSQAQRRALYAKDPKLAAEFEAATPKGKKLPEKVKPKAKPDKLTPGDTRDKPKKK
jgi:hypothetical protein